MGRLFSVNQLHDIYGCIAILEGIGDEILPFRGRFLSVGSVTQGGSTCICAKVPRLYLQ
jgi:hypothetical protein